MDPQDARVPEFLRTHKQAIIGTNRSDGPPHMTAVLAVYHEGDLLISIAEDRVKYRYLLRDPRATLVVLGDHFFQYMIVEGTTAMTNMPEAREMLRTYYELASGPHPNWEEYDEAMRREKRVLVRLAIQRVSGFNL